MSEQPPKRDVPQHAPGVDVERPLEPIEAPDEQLGEGIEESFPSSDPPSYTDDPAVKDPDLPSTGFPSEAPGG